VIYQRCGKSSIRLPLISLDLTESIDIPQNENADAQLMKALDLGINYWDISTQQISKQQQAEARLFSFLKHSGQRERIFLSTSISPTISPFFSAQGIKGIQMELDRMLHSLELDYVDLFLLNERGKDCPLDETISAISREFQRGRILYAGLWDFNTSDSQKWQDTLREAGVPLLLHKTPYSPGNREVEKTLDHLLEITETGMIAVDPFDLPEDSIQMWQNLAQKRNQTAEQMSIAWVLRQSYVNSVMLPLSTPQKMDQFCETIDKLVFEQDELDLIEKILRKDPSIG